MKIIKTKDNIVKFAGNDLQLTDQGVKGKNFRCRHITAANAVIEDVVVIPDDWQGNWYAYDGSWTMTLTGIDAKTAKEVEKVKKQARESLRQSDAGMIRVIEDLILALTTKGILGFSDLPEGAQEKIVEREEWRDES